jgi:integrase
MRLTASFVKSAAAEPGKERTFYWDETLPGFGLMVMQSGARNYVLQYRAAGQTRRMKLDFASLTLDEARREARKHRGDVAKGGDPLADRRNQAAAEKTAKTGTLEYIAEEYFRREDRKIRTMDERRAAFKRLIFPRLGKMQIEQISRSDLVRLLDTIEDERGPVMADKALAFLSKLFSWHASRSDTFRSPIVRGMGRTKPRERARARILSDDEIRIIWTVAERQQGPFNSLVRFLLLTGARRNEAAGMMRSEIVDSCWTVPAARYKSKQEFVLPLSEDAQAVLAAIPKIDREKSRKRRGRAKHEAKGPKADPVFTTNGLDPISGFSKAKRAFDKSVLAELRKHDPKAEPFPNWTLHDLRRTARSLMSRAGVPTDHAERALGHVIGGVRKVYDRYEYFSERQTALDALQGELRKILGK